MINDQTLRQGKKNADAGKRSALSPKILHIADP
jgi:hypothetical protein